MTPTRTALRPHRPHASLLAVPARSLVVLAGLPGAGKTTLLRRLDAAGTPGVRALDAEQVADRLRSSARCVPYRVLRPAVHSLHLLRVVRVVHDPAAVVLTTDPMTSPLRRALLHVVARSSRRSLHVVLVDATPAQALRGQRSRGRTLGRRRMARHVARAQRLRTRLARTGGMSFVDGVVVLPRPVARCTTALTVEPVGWAVQPGRGRAA